MKFSGTVIYGSSRIISAIATKLKTFSAIDLAAVSKTRWQQKHQEIEKLRKNRLQQRHFRQAPDTYLTKLETELLQSLNAALVFFEATKYRQPLWRSHYLFSDRRRRTFGEHQNYENLKS